MTGLSGSAMWVYAIGTVFTDTLWQGTLIGLSLLTGTLFLKTGDARSRYNLAAVAMLALILWTGYDLVRVIQHGRQFLALQAGINNTLLKEGLSLQDNQVIPTGDLSFSRIANFFYSLYSELGKYYYLIVPAWLTGIFFLSIRMAGGWMVANRTRKRDIFSLPYSWYTCAEYLNKKLKIRQTVILKGSYKVSGPMVIGYFRPVILVPATVISGLSYSEMEAILAHEFAHIRRHDFLFICIQHVAETLLFYHPVTWMISSFLSKEREKCCDDIAVSITNSSLPFAKAITVMENNRIQKKMPAAFLLSRNHNLLLRIKRILDQGIRKSSIAERFAASVIITAGLCTIFAFAGYTHNKSSGSQSAKVTGNVQAGRNDQMLPLPDTLKKYRETRTIEAEMADDSTKAITSYKLTYENDSVKDLFVNKKKINRNQLDEFRKKIDEIKDLRREEDWHKELWGWNINKRVKAELDMAMQQSKMSMEKAMLDMQLNQQIINEFNSESARFKREEMFKELQKLLHENMLKDWMMHSWDSSTLNRGNIDNPIFPKMNEQQVKEMKQKMERLQKQIGEEMMKFQEEFQKNHGKMMDSLKREMEKLQKSMPLMQDGAFFDLRPFLNTPDFHFDNAFVFPGQWPELWKKESPDTSEMEKTLRKLEN
jgi:bla regulator protein BlaR1